MALSELRLPIEYSLALKGQVGPHDAFWVWYDKAQPWVPVKSLALTHVYVW